MQSRPAADHASVIDVLERVLDKGIVIDAWVRASLAGIDLLTVGARVVIASITTDRGVWIPLPAVPPGPPMPRESPSSP
jgi:hypothetical protein